ncbi:hypothetical protein ACFT2C_04685 [Promicromonospora sp. NPDC057138]|uniref:hypothetical protein n=1 Tax=Promicromonospora sp. NPDC057138 TaxID=3346031 RepID=UPI00363C23E8
MNTALPEVPDADPVETAAAVAITMRRLVAETSTLTSLDQAPQITDELLAVLREVANVTTHLSTLALRQPDPPVRRRDTAARAWIKAQAVNGFTDAAARISFACQPLATGRNNATRLLPQPQPGATWTAPGNDAPDRPRTDPDPPGTHRALPAREESSHMPAL